jgi:hypothetical protein
MAFFTFFTRHTDASAAAPVKERLASDMTGDSERKGVVVVAAPLSNKSAVVDEKVSSASSDDSDTDSDSALETPPGVPIASLPQSSLPSTVPSEQQDPLEPTSPSSIPSLSQLAATMLDAPLERKDQRAYEVARQSKLKPADREKAREQKAKLKQAAALGRAAKAQSQSQAAATMPLSASLDGAASNGNAVKSGNRRRGNVRGTGEDGEDATNVNVKAMTTSPRKDAQSGTGARKAHEVKLEDLLRTAKIRKPRKGEPCDSMPMTMTVHCLVVGGSMLTSLVLFVAAGDFELIPHVRSVVALDDREYDTPEVEEAWEHVSSDEDDKKARSYAQVVSAAKA